VKLNTHHFNRKAAMKAARMHEYGKALVLEDVPVPDIKEPRQNKFSKSGIDDSLWIVPCYADAGRIQH